MGEISEDDKAMWKEVFDEYDKDGSGQLSREEIEDVMRCCHHNPTAEMIDEMMSNADKNNDSTVDFDEFCSFMQQMPDPDSSMREALQVFEEDGGTISREELKKILCGDNEDPDIDAILEEADVNKDGLIDKEEFINIIQCR